MIHLRRCERERTRGALFLYLNHVLLVHGLRFFLPRVANGISTNFLFDFLRFPVRPHCQTVRPRLTPSSQRTLVDGWRVDFASQLMKTHRLGTNVCTSVH